MKCCTVNNIQIYMIFSTICFIEHLVFTSTANPRYNDYDFPEADDLLANTAFATRKQDTLSQSTPNSTWPSFWSFHYNVFTAGSNKQSPLYSFSTPESSIGYEVPCGIRHGSIHNKNDDTDGNRIVGGIKALPGEFPWQISLQLRSGWISRHICGGAVLSSYWVVTAGHCVADLKPGAVTVVAGDHDIYKHEGTEQRVNVVRIVNAGYRAGNFTGDIALLQVNPPFKMDGKRISPVCLPNPRKSYTSGNATVAGWGKLSEHGELPHILHHVTLPIMPLHHCKKLYDDAGYGKYMSKCQICGGYERGGVDSCQGDSGGPLVCQHADTRYYLCGVVSWGVGCARPRMPGVYTEVSCYSDWIKSILYNVNGIVSALPAYNKNK